MQGKTNNSTFAWVLVIACVLLAVIGYTLHNARAMSYLSDDSSACNNCHVMNDVYASWQKSSHSLQINGKPRASCNDCHLPHEFISKWIDKARSGLTHAYAFTFKLDDLPQYFSATSISKVNVQNNCVRCHLKMVAAVVNPTTDVNHKNSQLSCVKCHPSVGHTRGF